MNTLPQLEPSIYKRLLGSDDQKIFTCVKINMIENITSQIIIKIFKGMGVFKHQSITVLSHTKIEKAEVQILPKI